MKKQKWIPAVVVTALSTCLFLFFAEQWMRSAVDRSSLPARVSEKSVRPLDPLPLPMQRIPLAADEKREIAVSTDERPLIKGCITVSTDGTPVQGAVVRAHGVGDPRSIQAVSDADGIYLLSGLRRTAYLIEATAEGLGSGIHENALPDRGEVDFQLEPPGKLRGTVRPVKRFTVELIRADYQLDRMSLPSITMETAFHRAYHGKHRRFERLHDFETMDGSFEIEGLGRGKYHVRVSSRR